MLKVLFVCTENSARSQMAEVILNGKQDCKLVAFSAGSNPALKLDPYVEKLFIQMGINPGSCKPKSIDIYDQDEFTYIITLCEKARLECPRLSENPIYAHWDIQNPSNFTGTDEEKYNQYRKIFIEIANRINNLISLPHNCGDRKKLESMLNM